MMLLKPRKKVFTMNEIAAACQVSLSTVYRILRKPERAATPVQIQVRGLLVQNGYLSDFHYPAKINLLCVTVPGEYMHSSAMFFELQKICMEQNIGLSLCNYAQLESMVRMTDARGILFNICPAEWKIFPLPCVVLKPTYSTGTYTSVGEDDVGGLLMLFHHLKSLGHRRIFYFVPVEYNEKIHLQERFCLDKIKSLYTLNGLSYEEDLICCRHVTPQTHHRMLNEAVDYFLRLKNRPTAVVLSGDIYAGDFYRYLRAAGLRIPEDVSIAGIDNLRRYCSFIDQSVDTFAEVCHLDPPLTTVDYPLEEIASAAVELLLKQIENPLQPRRRILLQPELILTNSITKAKGKR